MFGDVWGISILAQIPPREVFGCPGIDRNLLKLKEWTKVERLYIFVPIVNLNLCLGSL